MSSAQAETQPERVGVQLETGMTAGGLLHTILCAVQAEFDELRHVSPIPRQRAEFRKTIASSLRRFEASRVRSSQRVQIARRLSSLASEGFKLFGSKDSHPVALEEALTRKARPLSMQSMVGKADIGPLQADSSFTYRGDIYAPRELKRVLERLESHGDADLDACVRLREMLKRCATGLDLRGHRFAIMGANAELAPTKLLLRAGADLLWIDRIAPQLQAKDFVGSLTWLPATSDLLADPCGIRAAIEAFAEDGPIHLGCFAYAPGQGREWRLCMAMNAIARALAPRALKSVGLYVSPTSPIHFKPEDQKRNCPMWRTLARKCGLLNHEPLQGREFAVSNTLLRMQGMSYQGAQYVAKTLFAEVLAADRRLRVSANVAPIARTTSLDIPMFQAAFAGARHFGLEVFDAKLARLLMGLLYVSDVTDGPEDLAVGSAPTRALVHGGVIEIEDALEGAMRMAAMFGMPRGLFR